MSTWSVYEVDIAHRIEPTVRACIQHVRARTPEESVQRALAKRDGNARHLESHSVQRRARDTQGKLILKSETITSPRRRRACEPLEVEAEEAALAATEGT